MMLRLDGTETIADLRETMCFLADLKKHVGNHKARREIDAEIDQLLDAELRITQQARRQPGDC